MQKSAARCRSGATLLADVATQRGHWPLPQSELAGFTRQPLRFSGRPGSVRKLLGRL